MVSSRASRKPAYPAKTARYATGITDQSRSTHEYSRVTTDSSQVPAQAPANIQRQTERALTTVPPGRRRPAWTAAP
jgi:hypothetical protein